MDWTFMYDPLFVLSGTEVTPLRLATALVTALIAIVGGMVLRRVLDRALRRLGVDPEPAANLAKLALWVLVAFGVMSALQTLGLQVAQPFLSLGGVDVSVFSLVTLLAFVTLVTLGAKVMGELTESRFLGRTKLDEGVRYAFGRMVYYLLLVIGYMAVLQIVGIQLASLTVILGALSVGIGFGLQNIVNNFVSGMILLFERPIKVGDWIEVNETNGRVTNIGARSTTVVTRDNITIIIPNGDCISNQMINWSYGDPKTRIRIPVGVAYGSDMDRVREALLKVASEHSAVLDEPEPQVLFDGFGDSSLDLELAIWVDIRTIAVRRLRSDLNFAIDRVFREFGVEIPFPQRDVHFRNPLTSTH